MKPAKITDERQSSPCKTVLAAPGPDVLADWVTPQRCRIDGGLFCRGRYHETKFSVNRFQEWVPGSSATVSERVIFQEWVVDQSNFVGSPGGTPQRSPRWKLREPKPRMTRKPRQGRHFGLTRTNVAHHPRMHRGTIYLLATPSRTGTLFPEPPRGTTCPRGGGDVEPDSQKCLSYPAAGVDAAVPSGCGVAPLIRSHSMIATSPSWAGKVMLETTSSYRGNRNPVKLMAK